MMKLARPVAETTPSKRRLGGPLAQVWRAAMPAHGRGPAWLARTRLSFVELLVHALHKFISFLAARRAFRKWRRSSTATASQAGRPRLLTYAAFEALCGACFGGGGEAGVLASRASRSLEQSACASRSTSGHFIVTLRYVVQSLPMTMREFLQSTLPPSLEGISTGSLSPGRTPWSRKAPSFPTPVG